VAPFQRAVSDIGFSLFSVEWELLDGMFAAHDQVITRFLSDTFK
jgi:hypothetical protein